MPKPPSVPQIHSAALSVLVAVSFVLLGMATVLFFGAGSLEGREGAADQLVIAWLMAVIGALLLVGEQNDERARWFGHFLVFSATGFCYLLLDLYGRTTGGLIATLPAHIAPMAVGPYCLWRLAAGFPRGIDRAAVRRTLQMGTITAWLFAWGGLAANLALWVGFTPAEILDQRPAEGLFQILGQVLNAAALLVIAVRWLTTSQRDRRRAGPFLATLGVLAFMIAAVVSASLLRTPVESTRTAFAAAVVALLPCLVGAIRQRGLHVRMAGTRPLLRHLLNGLSWAVLAAPVLIFWFRWTTQRPSFDLQLLFLGSLIATAVAVRPRRRAPSSDTAREEVALVQDAPRLANRRERDEWLSRIQEWSGATSARLFAVHAEDTGPLLDPLPESGSALRSLLYLHRTTLDLERLDPLEFEELQPETRRWIAEQRLALIQPILSTTDHLLGLLVLGRPSRENTHRPETTALLPILAAGLAPVLTRLRERPLEKADSDESVFAAALCSGCDSVYSVLVERCPECRRDLVTLQQPLLIAENYQLEKRLGRGSWGAVFQARDLLLERSVALKFFHLRGDAGSAALLREARALVSLRGPQLADIYGAEHTDRGLVLITELLDGGVLAERMVPDTPTMDCRAALEFAKELLGCLRPLHDRDLVHGDIKPSNLGFNAQGRLKLIDFGMVRALREGTLPSTPSSGDMTVSTLLPGGQPGTPIYSPPESWHGEPVGVSGDLWPVAVLLWELITGEHPFVQDGDDIKGLGERIRRGETNPWPATVRRPPRLTAFFERALHTDPGRRYVDLPAMERAIHTILDSGLH